MTNNDVLRRLRYAFDFNDTSMIELFALAGLQVTRQQVSDWLKKDEDAAFVACSDEQLATFLDGLIAQRRGKSDGPRRQPEKRLTNNLVLRKLRIALDLKDEDLLELLALAGMPVGKPELNALFRRPGHKNYRECKDQLLRNFLQGIQLRYRASHQSK